MKRYIIGFISAIAALGVAFAGIVVYDTLTVNGELYLNGIQEDGLYPFLSIDTNGKVYKNQLIGVSAHLTGTKSLVTTSADVNYPVPGPFENDVIIGFFLSGDSIIYTGNDTLLSISYSTSLTTDTDNVTITADILQNGVSEGKFISKGTAPKTTTSLSLNGIGSIYITSGDSIQLVMQADVTGSILSIDSFSTVAKRF